MDEIKTLAFTGLRPFKLPWGPDETNPACIAMKNHLRERLIQLIEADNVRNFISGMAIGIDQICAELVLEMKTQYPDITLEAATPCSDQDRKWPQKSRERRIAIMQQCDSVYTASETYVDGCMHMRNRYMVEKCDVLMAVWNGRPGGTSTTVKYARSKNKEVIIVDPNEFVNTLEG